MAPCKEDVESVQSVLVRGVAPQYPTRPRVRNRIQDATLSYINPNTISFLNKTHFKYSFVKDNYPYENIYVYISC